MVQVTQVRRTLASSPKSECATCHQQGHVGSKTLFQQNPPVSLLRVPANTGCPVRLVIVVVVVEVKLVTSSTVQIFRQQNV